MELHAFAKIPSWQIRRANIRSTKIRNVKIQSRKTKIRSAEIRSAKIRTLCNFLLKSTLHRLRIDELKLSPEKPRICSLLALSAKALFIEAMSAEATATSVAIAILSIMIGVRF